MGFQTPFWNASLATNLVAEPPSLWLSCEDAKLLTGGRLPGTSPFSFISWSRDQLSVIMKTVLFWKFCWQELEKHIKIRYPQEPITLVFCKILVFHRNPCKVRNFQTVVKYKKALRDSNLVFIHNRRFQKDLETVWKFQFFVWKTIQAWLGGKSSFLLQIPLIIVWKFTGYLLLKCSSSSCEQNFPKANYFCVYRKFATWRTFAKGPIYWSSVTVHSLETIA